MNIKGIKYVVISKTYTELLSQFNPRKSQYFPTNNTEMNISVHKSLINA